MYRCEGKEERWLEILEAKIEIKKIQLAAKGSKV